MSNSKSVKSRVKAMIPAGLFRVVSLITPTKVAILRYHSVQDQPERFANTIGSGIIHSTSAFREQMEILASDFSPVTVQDVYEFLRGEKRLPPRAVAVTFDDGYADNYEIAAPILNRLGIPAAFYVLVSAIEALSPPWYCRLRYAFSASTKETWRDGTNGTSWSFETPQKRKAAFLEASRRCAQLAGETQTHTLEAIEHELDVEPLKITGAPMMTWEQARQLVRDGHIVGPHTLTHPNLAYVDEAVLEKELTESRNIAEQKLGSPAVHFSYPSPILEPHFTERTIECTRKAGYRTAVTCARGPVGKDGNPLALTRIFGPFEREEFRWAVESSLVGYVGN